MRKVLFLFSLMIFYSCNMFNDKIILINNTEDPIYYQLHTDTVPYSYAKYNIDGRFYLLYPNDTVKPSFSRGSKETWAYKINRECIDSALHIFIFSTYQITDEMIKNRDYVRLSFKVKELDSLNWTVVYRGQNKIEEEAVGAP